MGTTIRTPNGLASYPLPELFEEIGGAIVEIYAYAYDYRGGRKSMYAGRCISLGFKTSTANLLMNTSTSFHTSIQLYNKEIMHPVPEIVQNAIRKHMDKIIMLVSLSDDQQCIFTRE